MTDGSSLPAPDRLAHPEGVAPGAAVVVPERLLAAARTARRVLILTGAGMSAESGVPTFRDAHTGLWEQFDQDQLVTRRAWEEEPELVWAWHWWLARLVRRSMPHAGHEALARWATRPGVTLTIVTQNVDDLHERSGCQVAAHLHGDLFSFACSECGAPVEIDVPPLGDGEVLPERSDPPTCAQCGGDVRPRVVLFGEALPEGAFDTGVEAALDADLALVIGTSGTVQPAASLPDLARGHGALVVELNPHETELTLGVDVVWRETAGRALPALVDALDG